MMSLPGQPPRATSPVPHVVAPSSQLHVAPSGLPATPPPAAPPQVAHAPVAHPPVAPPQLTQVEGVRAFTPPPTAYPGASPSQNAPVAPPTASHVGVVHVAADETASNNVRLDHLLLHLMEVGGSDLHLSAGSKPRVRIHGEMAVVDNSDVLTPDAIQTAIYPILNGKQQKAFEESLELDFAYSIQGEGRFRVNIFRQRNSVGAVFRTIPWEIKSLESLKMPAILNTFSSLPRGLVLVCGPTGSGKSTTLAAIVDQANRTRNGHIMTIEDPIEFLHHHRRSVVNQRQVGEDTLTFAGALKRVLRQDPDIILVGELRDLETIAVALTAAETGHLVFATLHTQSAAETITRLVDVFPPGQQSQVRTQLSATLQAVVCQELCKTADGNGRVAAVEIMICDTGIRSMIRDGKLQQISGALETGSKNGSQTLNQHLAALVLSGQISYDVAREKCTSKDDLETVLNGRHGPERKLDTSGSFMATNQPGQRSPR
jgi:twitching motility protein PilT